MSESNRLSVNIWRTRRVLAAPREIRMAISMARAVERASSKLATFAQAISNRTAATPNTIHNGRANSLRTSATPVAAACT
jgi:hypothetical protein